jgi:sn-glycerol 3-phosphate transport system permease protein
MVEKTPVLDVVAHLIMLVGVALVCLPIYFVYVTGSLSQEQVLALPMPWLPGDQLLANIATAWQKASFGRWFFNSVVMSLGVVAGKITVSLLAAFAVTYFRFPFRMTAFWLIFVSLMLPIEVRIVPTYEAAANAALPLNVLVDWLHLEDLWGYFVGHRVEFDLEWSLVNTYSGLILPLIASATATFLFRQFFLTVPDELTEAARVDGAKPMQFFWMILLPLSRSNILAMAIILFLASWNQYLWPLLVTTEKSMATAVIGLRHLMPSAEAVPTWHVLMSATLITMIPPVLVVLVAQRWFVKGLIDSGK